jgi:hypothetical protein
VPREHQRGLRLARLPDRDARVFAAGHDPAVRKKGDRVDRALMEAQHLLGRVPLQRPADHRGVEAAGERLRPVRRNRERADRPAMAAQLRLRPLGCHRRKQHEDNEGT